MPSSISRQWRLSTEDAQEGGGLVSLAQLAEAFCSSGWTLIQGEDLSGILDQVLPISEVFYIYLLKCEGVFPTSHSCT